MVEEEEEVNAEYQAEKDENRREREIGNEETKREATQERRKER